MTRIFTLLTLLIAVPTLLLAQTADTVSVGNQAFELRFANYGITDLMKHQDVYKTDYVRPKQQFTNVVVRYKNAEGKLDSTTATDGLTAVSQDGKQVAQWGAGHAAKALGLSQDFKLSADALSWTFTIKNNQTKPISIEDLALPIFYNNQGGENSHQIFEEHVIKHHFISGNNSYVFWERPTGLGPYLLMTTLPGTWLEYFDVKSGRRGTFNAYIHSAYTSASKKSGTWRQPNSSESIAAGGQKTYGFKFRWAKDYNDIRNILVQEGLIDVQVMPGMTVPTDLDVNLLLNTHQTIEQVNAEHPDGTVITQTADKNGKHFYHIRFAHLGENKLTVTYGNNYKTYLEFFVTEPLATLYKKRAAFLVNHQQHRDSTKWYNGLFSLWDMKNKVLRGPDNTDGFDGFQGYVLASDDPALGKAPFIAAKNVVYPNQKEIDAVEYYIKNFVWGKLQRTDKEMPYPYGVYGTPNWLVARDVEKRKLIATTNLDKEHIWRSYDYPHIMMLYFHMYQIAKMHPEMTHYLDAKAYLIRAKETAKAYFTYPYDILPWYETYKWGCYDEVLLMDLMATLRTEGYANDADWLRKEWEKKVKYFLYDDPYPFRSEYAVDATAYESTHAIAKYAIANKMQPDSNLWYDKNLKRWYSHPQIDAGDGRKFMAREVAANIASRGWLEAAYYYMGSDFRGKSDSFTLTYMAPMGGWGILDYGLNFSTQPGDYIRLGYASYLSAFALMNTGTAASNYGYWYPGKENDGATGWAFEPQQYTSTWIKKEQGRGPWYYDGEIDLGYGGATRMAATIITNDPVFGLVAYGGNLKVNHDELSVIPKDGLGTRFYYRAFANTIDLEFKSDGLSATAPVIIDKYGKKISFEVENRIAIAHNATATIKGLSGKYQLTVNGRKLQTITCSVNNTNTLTIPVTNAGNKVILVKVNN